MFIEKIANYTLHDGGKRITGEIEVAPNKYELFEAKGKSLCRWLHRQRVKYENTTPREGHQV